MSEAKFTPGPWTAVQHGEGIYTWTIRGNDEMEDRSLAVVGVGTPNLQRDEANMHLIATAPEMYAELERICMECCDDSAACSCCNVRKILAKARGESESSDD